MSRSRARPGARRSSTDVGAGRNAADIVAPSLASGSLSGGPTARPTVVAPTTALGAVSDRDAQATAGTIGLDNTPITFWVANLDNVMGLPAGLAPLTRDAGVVDFEAKFYANLSLLHNADQAALPAPFNSSDLKPAPFHMPSRAALVSHFANLALCLQRTGLVTIPEYRGAYLTGCMGSGKSTALLDISAGVAMTCSKEQPYRVVPIYFPSPLMALDVDFADPFGVTPTFSCVRGSASSQIIPVPPAVAIVHALKSVGISLESLDDPLPPCLRWTREAFKQSHSTGPGSALSELTRRMRSRKLTSIVTIDEFTDVYRLDERAIRYCIASVNAVRACWYSQAQASVAFVVSGSHPALADIMLNRLSSTTAQALGFSTFFRSQAVHPQHTRSLHMERMGNLADFLWMLKYSGYPRPPPAAFREVLECFDDSDPTREEDQPARPPLIPFPPCHSSQVDVAAPLKKRIVFGGETFSPSELYLATLGAPRSIAAIASQFYTADDSASHAGGIDPRSPPSKSAIARALLNPPASQKADWSVLQALASLVLHRAPNAPSDVLTNPFGFPCQTYSFSIAEVQDKLDLMYESGLLSAPSQISESVLFVMAEEGLINFDNIVARLSFSHPAVFHDSLKLIYRQACSVSDEIHRVMTNPQGKPAEDYGELLAAASLALEHPDGYASVLGYLIANHAHWGPKVDSDQRAAYANMVREASVSWRKTTAAPAFPDLMGATPRSLSELFVNPSSGPNPEPVQPNTLYSVILDSGVDHVCVFKNDATKTALLCALQTRLSRGAEIVPYKESRAERSLAVGLAHSMERWALRQVVVDQMRLHDYRIVHINGLITNREVSESDLATFRGPSLEYDTAHWTKAVESLRLAKASAANSDHLEQDSDDDDGVATPAAKLKGKRADSVYKEALMPRVTKVPGITFPDGASIIADYKVMQDLWAPPVRLMGHTWRLPAYGGAISDASKLAALIQRAGGITNALLDPTALSKASAEARRVKEAASRAEEQARQEEEKARREEEKARRAEELAEEKARRAEELAEERARQAEETARLHLKQLESQLTAVIPGTLLPMALTLAAMGISVEDLRAMNVEAFQEVVRTYPWAKTGTSWFKYWKLTKRN